MAKMTVAEMTAFLACEFPQAADRMRVVSLSRDGAEVEMVMGPADLRPGGTVSGPSLFLLADVAFYVAVLAGAGPKALAVTTNASVDFMRKPEPGPIRARARIHKRGRVLVVGDVLLFGPGEKPVARASLTYSMPPEGNSART